MLPAWRADSRLEHTSSYSNYDFAGVTINLIYCLAERICGNNTTIYIKKCKENVQVRIKAIRLR